MNVQYASIKQYASTPSAIDCEAEKIERRESTVR